MKLPPLTWRLLRILTAAGLNFGVSVRCAEGLFCGRCAAPRDLLDSNACRVCKGKTARVQVAR